MVKNQTLAAMHFTMLSFVGWMRAAAGLLKLLLLGSAFIVGSAWAEPCEALMARLTTEAAQNEAAFDAEFARCIANYPDQYVCGHMISPYKAVFSGSSGYITWTYCNPQSQGGACSTGKSEPQTCGACPPDQLWSSTLQACFPTKVVDQSGKPPPGPCEKVGKPIYPLTGAEEEAVDTLLSIGSAPVIFAYNSFPYAAPPLGSSLTPSADLPGLGAYWHGSLMRRLVVQANLLGARALRGDGSIVTFVGDGVGGFTGDADGKAKLSSIASGYRLQDPSSSALESYDSTGRLLRIDNLDSSSLAFTYSDASTPPTVAPAPGYLITVTDGFGRRVQFAYSLLAGADPATGGRLAQVIGTGGEVVAVAFDAGDRLASFTWPDAAIRKPVYELPGSPMLLTGMVDENNSRYFTIGYDPQGRANSSVLAGGVDAYTIQYGTPPQAMRTVVFDDVQRIFFIYYTMTAPAQTTITYPNSQTVGVDAVAPLGYPLVSGRSQPAGSGCAAATSALMYDANGNPARQDGFNGNRTCRAYDTSRNLLTIELEGLPGGTAGKTCPANLASYVPSAADAAHPERKTTTSWHPDRRLKTREAEPKKISTWVYNGQPDPVAGGTAACAPGAPALPDGKPITVLCARYEQATTDATGALGLGATVTDAARKWSYTYNTAGQLATVTTPKQSAMDALSHTTTFAYYTDTALSGNVGHTIGDLHTVTNPLGQATTFTSYDGAGRLLASAAANGVVTSATYWPRGWLKSQAIAAAGGGAAPVTQFAYWPTGLLKSVTLPDAGVLSYTYDDAHRLTDITDAAGNRVHYVLDNAGRRTSEQVSDASSSLASSVTRVFDALGRVQSQVGANH